MKTPAEVADHPVARLQRELVALLRTTGSVAGAERAWQQMKLEPRLWRRIETFGFAARLPGFTFLPHRNLLVRATAVGPNDVAEPQQMSGMFAALV